MIQRVICHLNLMTLCYYDNNLLVVCVIRFFKNAVSRMEWHFFWGGISQRNFVSIWV